MSKVLNVGEPLKIGGAVFRIETRLTDNVVLFRVIQQSPDPVIRARYYTAKSEEEAQAFLLGFNNGVEAATNRLQGNRA